jgi:hypothetical protein
MLHIICNILYLQSKKEQKIFQDLKKNGVFSFCICTVSLSFSQNFGFQLFMQVKKKSGNQTGKDIRKRFFASDSQENFNGRFLFSVSDLENISKSFLLQSYPDAFSKILLL